MSKTDPPDLDKLEKTKALIRAGLQETLRGLESGDLEVEMLATTSAYDLDGRDNPVVMRFEVRSKT